MVNSDEEDGNGRGRPRSEMLPTQTTVVGIRMLIITPPITRYLHFFFLDLISIEIQPTFGEFSSSRIDLFSSRRYCRRNTTTSWQMYVPISRNAT